MSADDLPRTYASLITHPGRGAIAVVRLWGPRALAIGDTTFRPVKGSGLAATPAGRLRVGRMGQGMGDEVVAVVIDPDLAEIEIQGHGGSAATEMILDALRALGVEVVDVARWLRRSSRSRLFSQAEEDLARAPTLRSAEILLHQSEGVLEAAILAILERIESAIPQDIQPLASDHRLPSQGELTGEIDALLERSRAGVRLVEGWRVALAGRPNVGKSRLFNRLAGFERTIVAAQPGTTRDAVAIRLAIDGWPVELVNTAGLRNAADPIESEGIARARASQQGADLVLLVLDRSAPLDANDRVLVEQYPTALRVANKSDLPYAWDASEFGAIGVSAATGEGVPFLLDAVAERLPTALLDAGVAVPFRSSHVRVLKRASRYLSIGKPRLAALALRHLLDRGRRRSPITEPAPSHDR